MNRKNFLSSIVPLTASFSAVTKGQRNIFNRSSMFEDDKTIKIPLI